MKRDARGRTAPERYGQLAETSYESALMELADLLEPYDKERKHYFDYKQAENIRQLLDRPVDCSIGNDPNADCVSVPRLRSSRSKYTIKNDIATTSKHEYQLGCQLDTLISAALELLYGEHVSTTQAELTDKQRSKLKQLMSRLNKCEN